MRLFNSQLLFFRVVSIRLYSIRIVFLYDVRLSAFLFFFFFTVIFSIRHASVVNEG